MNTSNALFTEEQVKVFEQTRNSLVIRMGIMFLTILTIITITNSLNPHFSSIPDLIAIALVGSCLLIQKLTNKYKLTSIIGVIGATITIAATIFLVPGLHLSTPIWMITVVLFTYLMLEKLWGAIVMFVNFGSLIVYLLTIFDERMNDRFIVQPSDKYTFVAEFIVQALAIGYMLHVFLKASQIVQNHLIENQRKLSEQNELILTQKKQIEVMFKEIHHRIKNNLQIISSFLKLQSDYDAEKSQATYLEAVNRVNTIALIHEKIYKTETFQKFELVSYTENLVSYICDSYPIEKDVRAYTEIENFEASSNMIVPFAMILNELITNSIRHAFCAQEKPKLNIKIKSVSEDNFILDFSYNGKRSNGNEPFGSEIMCIMTEQLGGKFNREISENGTTYKFELSKK